MTKVITTYSNSFKLDYNSDSETLAKVESNILKDLLKTNVGIKALMDVLDGDKSKFSDGGTTAILDNLIEITSKEVEAVDELAFFSTVNLDQKILFLTERANLIGRLELLVQSQQKEMVTSSLTVKILTPRSGVFSTN